MDYGVLRAWYVQGENARILEVFSKTPAPHPPEALFYVAAAFINSAEEPKAALCIEKGLTRASGDLRADLLALQAFLHIRRGDLSGYLEGAQNAVSVASTPLTLYHLGLAQPESAKGFKALQAALVAAEEAKDTFAEARNAYALSVALLRLGRYREALHWARYAEVRNNQPDFSFVLLDIRSYLQVLLGEIGGVEEELRSALESLERAYPSTQKLLPIALADILQSQGRYEEALTLYQDQLQSAARKDWPKLARGAVRALTALGRGAEATTLAETALSVAGELSYYHHALAHLALGLALWPEPTAHPHLKVALEDLLDRRAPPATEAALHLAASNLIWGDEAAAHQMYEQANINELGETGLQLLGGKAVPLLRPLLSETAPFRVLLFGQAAIYQAGRQVTLRPKGLEILALLLAHPKGLSAESLSEAIYEGVRLNALRVEIYRLRSALDGELESRPYRLNMSVWSDLTEVNRSLKKGQLEAAVSLYQGPLLPNSEAPGIVGLRKEIEAQIQGATLASRDPEMMWTLAQALNGDLELWEDLFSILPNNDPRRITAAGRIARIKQELEL